MIVTICSVSNFSKVGGAGQVYYLCIIERVEFCIQNQNSMRKKVAASFRQDPRTPLDQNIQWWKNKFLFLLQLMF